MPVIHELDNYDLAEFVRVASRFGDGQYGYVVTPNVDHLIRFCDDDAFRSAYADASYVLLDSRFLSYLLRITHGFRAPVAAGSDITAMLIQNVVRPENRIVLIGGTHEQAEDLRRRYSLQGLVHCNPPMGFIRSPEEVEKCLRFIEQQSPFRFCFLAVGCPQQETIAQQLRQRGVARGLALCIGASINFLTGEESRAPRWMQRAGIEWLYRLANDPRRLAKRYLLRGPRIFGLLPRIRFVLRPASIDS